MTDPLHSHGNETSSRGPVGTPVAVGQVPASPEGKRAAAQPLSLRLRDTRVQFRVFLLVALLVCLCGFAALAIQRPGAPFTEIVREPGFLLLMFLVLLSDLYPAVPWLRELSERNTTLWSAVFTVTAVLAYGPQAGWLFLLSGLACTAFRTVGRWWRAAVNTILLGLQGLAAVATQMALVPGSGSEVPTTVQSLMVISVCLAVVVQVVNGLLIPLAGATLGRGDWWSELEDWWRTGFPWGAELLITPILAVTALDVPALLPLLAVLVVAVQHGVNVLTRRTRQARTDGLTGLANRPTVVATVDSQLHDLRRHPGSVTFMLIDLDRFKSVNDRHGHPVGDVVLAQVAQRLLTAARPDDLVGRYGGDEFAVVLPNAEPEEVRAVADNVTAALADPYEVGDLRLAVGGSIGYARTSDPNTASSQLVERADQSLYQTKSLQTTPLPPVIWTGGAAGTSWPGSAWAPPRPAEAPWTLAPTFGEDRKRNQSGP